MINTVALTRFPGALVLGVEDHPEPTLVTRATADYVVGHNTGRLHGAAWWRTVQRTTIAGEEHWV